MGLSSLRLGQAKDCKIGLCYFSATHTVLMNKGKVWLAQNQDNVFEWGDIFSFIEIALCKSKLACWSSTKRTSSSSYRTQLVLAMIYLEIPNLVLNNNHSLTHYGTYFLGSFYFSLITCSVG